MPTRRHLHFDLPPRYELRLTLFGHGWISLAPHHWDEERGVFRTACEVDGQAVDVRVSQQRDHRLAARIDAHRPLGRSGMQDLRRGLRRILRLDDDLDEFWRMCRTSPRLSWVARRGAGRMMQSHTLFEDLLKLLFTTNCSWPATRLMCQRLADAAGPEAPSGRRAFPSARSCAALGAPFFRDVVRAGYRAPSCARLAEGFASGEWSEAWFGDPDLTIAERRARLLALPGFGPYAAGLALRGLGHYEDLALDSWCRAQLAAMHGKKRPPNDRSVEKTYAPFGAYKGLALWMDLTADWHGEGPRAPAEAGAAPRTNHTP